MNPSGITNALNALTGGKAPTSNPARQQPATAFNQILSREVAQRQPAPAVAKSPAPAKPHAAEKQHAPEKQKATEKTRAADVPKSEEAASPKAETPATAESKAEDTADGKDATTSLADIPGAPQAALIMNLMAQVAAVPDTDGEAVPLEEDGAGRAQLDLGQRASKGPVKLIAADELDVKAKGAGETQMQDLDVAFGKAMGQANAQRDAKALAAAKVDGLNAALIAPKEDRITGAQAAIASLQPSQIAQAASVHTDRLTPPVGTSAWDQALGQKVVWMVKGGEQTAMLTMNPPDLGPLQVVLSVIDNQAMVNFTSAQPEVREALETALPRLQEMLKESGIQLGQANVNAGSQQFSGFNGSANDRNSAGRGTGSESVAGVEESPRLRESVIRVPGNGAVDTFA